MAVAPVQILLVEDDPDDVLLTQEALADAKVANEIRVVSDGEAAMSALRREGEFSDWPTPDLVLLDLNLPKKDGREVLRDIKSDPVLHRIPIVVLTTSGEEEDVVGAYDQHVNAYVQKPVGFDSFVEVVRSLEEFWLAVVKLPPDAGSRPPG